MDAGEEMKSKTSFSSLILFLGPSIALIVVFFFLPVMTAFVLSFTDFDIYSLGSLEVYDLSVSEIISNLFNDPLFWKALKNTFYFVLVGGPFSVTVSLGAAATSQLKTVSKFKNTFRLSYFIPVVTTLVAVAIVWRSYYHPNFGISELFFRLVWYQPDRLARRSTICYARNYFSGGMEKFWLQHDHFYCRICKIFPTIFTKPLI